MKKVRIGGTFYELEFKDGLYVGDKKVSGYINYSDGQIRVDSNLPHVSLEETIVHEIIHGIETEYELDLEERDVKCLARGFINVMIDNEGLMAQILKDVRKKVKQHEEAKDGK